MPGGAPCQVKMLSSSSRKTHTHTHYTSTSPNAFLFPQHRLSSLYYFTLAPYGPMDYTAANFYTSCFPDSAFLKVCDWVCQHLQVLRVDTCHTHCTTFDASTHPISLWPSPPQLSLRIRARSVHALTGTAGGGCCIAASSNTGTGQVR